MENVRSHDVHLRLRFSGPDADTRLGVTPVDEIWLASAGEVDSTSAVYYLASPDSATKSVTIKEFVGADKSVVTTGNVVESIKFNLPTADIATLEFSVAGCAFTTSKGFF